MGPFPHELVRFACPLINPPSQHGLFQNKLHNLQLAIDRMQGTTLPPGASFNFWAHALPPTTENGYREGAMFIRNRVTTSTGGGLCQLSGLLYNLALLAGCGILERFPHSIDAYGEARYLPLGRDATLAYGYKNLRFANGHNFALRLELAVNEREVSGVIWSEQAFEGRIELSTRELAVLPPAQRVYHDAALAPGEQRVEVGLVGRIVGASRQVFLDDGRVWQEPLSRDHYRATPTRVYRRLGLVERGLHRIHRGLR